MVHLQKHQPPRSHRLLAAPWRKLLVAVGLLTIAVFGRSSSAEFETPFVDTSNGLANVEFRGVWAFDRGYEYLTTAFNRYEAFAVGVDTTNPDNATNGVIYFYDGSTWSRILSPMTGTAQPFSFNGVVGQMNATYGTLQTLWLIGPQGKMMALSNYTGTLGVDNKFPSSPFLNSTPSLYPALSAIDFYAIDTVNSYNERTMAGGQNGVIVKDYNSGLTGFKILPSSSTGIGANENITGIRFTTATEAYVTTTIFSNDASTSKPYSPFKHNCTVGNLTPTGYLYKADLTVVGDGTWTKVKTDVGNCFYGLAVAQNESFQSVVWVASEKGLYRYNAADGSWVVGTETQNKPQYSAVAISQHGGSGTNLLRNGDFNLSTNTLGWIQLGQLGYGRFSKTTTGACTPLGSEMSVNTTGGLGSNYLQVTNNSIYTNNTCTSRCIAPTIGATSGCTKNLEDGFTTGVFQTVPFTTIEGQRFKISGDYKVEFPGNLTPTPTKAQGGVVLTCGGSNVQSSPYFIDCSVSNRKLVHVYDPTQPNNGATDPNVNNGWKHFEMTISREDGVFSRFNRFGDTRVSKRKMDLQVRCEATFGATVKCDNLKVESIDQPATEPRTGVTVITAGNELAANGMWINEDALVSPAFVSEPVPNKVRLDAQAGIKNQINSMFAVGTQHIFAAGQGYDVNNAGVGLAIFNRTPSTLQGTIWAGAYSPTANNKAPAGSISVSCIDDRGASNTQPTLCQRVPESYGLSLGITSAAAATKTGRLTGRGWFGKTADSQESVDLGKCINPPNPPELGYYTILQGEYSGYRLCDYNYNSTSDIGSRRCRQIDSNGEISTSALTQVSCLTDFDCLGRCEKDSGFACLQDSDCRAGTPSPYDITWTFVPSQFGVPPSARLSCGTTTSGYQSSPLACTPSGWLSFNATDFSPAEATPPRGTFGVTYNTLYTSHNQLFDQQNKGAHELSGWGRFMTLAKSSDTGWVRLRGDSTPATGPFLYGCRNCDGGSTNQMNCSFCQDSSNHSCVPADDGVNTAKCYNVCKDAPTTRCTTDAGCSGTGPCIAPGYCTQDPSVYCQKDETCTGKGTCSIGAVCSTAGSQCTTYGVNLDTNTGKFSGYAWSQDFGWLSFQNVIYGGNRILQTKLGDIYATGQIGDSTVPLPPGGSSCNSTYLITSASSITGFCSSSGETINSLPTKQPNSTAIPFLSAENIYQNVLGRFDLVGIEKDVGGGKNKYGSSIQPLTAVGATNTISVDWKNRLVTNTQPATGKYLGGKVYVIGAAGSTTTYTLEAVMNFNNSDAAVGSPNLSGAGILIVNGNLTIAADMTYNADNVSITNDLRRLGSLTIVVKGNLIIENTVQKIVGAYYVTGSIDTATDIGTNQYPLTVYGLMIAKDFNFLRKFAGTIENPLPSELIIYDGRLQSNPMLGMTDFASSLPNSVSVSP